MKLISAFIFAIIVAGVVSRTATSHHSIAMYDHEHPIELEGTVQDFKFTSPHALILLEVRGREAESVIWNLEGSSPNSLTWDGWSRKTLKRGDELHLTVEPLRNGLPGGAWNFEQNKIPRR